LARQRVKIPGLKNVVSCCIMDLVLLTHSDRWVFLPNLIAYLLLPGLLFDFFRRMKMDLRAAWWWA
jgi:hypothetical protein